MASASIATPSTSDATAAPTIDGVGPPPYVGNTTISDGAQCYNFKKYHTSWDNLYSHLRLRCLKEGHRPPLLNIYLHEQYKAEERQKTMAQRLTKAQATSLVSERETPPSTTNERARCVARYVAIYSQPTEHAKCVARCAVTDCVSLQHATGSWFSPAVLPNSSSTSCAMPPPPLDLPVSTQNQPLASSWTWTACHGCRHRCLHGKFVCAFGQQLNANNTL